MNDKERSADFGDLLFSKEPKPMLAALNAILPLNEVKLVWTVAAALFHPDAKVRKLAREIVVEHGPESTSAYMKTAKKQYGTDSTFLDQKTFAKLLGDYQTFGVPAPLLAIAALRHYAATNSRFVPLALDAALRNSSEEKRILSYLRDVTALGLKDEVPEGLGQLASLRQITLTSGAKPMQRAENLRELATHSHPLAVYAELHGSLDVLGLFAERIESLSVSHRMTTDISVVNQLTNLRKLVIVATAITDISSVADSSIRFLDISMAHSQLMSVEPIERMAHLETLILTRQASGALNASASLSRTLKHVILNGREVNDLPFLSGLKHLRQLHLSNCPIQDLHLLAGLPLEEVELSYMKDAVDLSVFFEMPSLRVLRLPSSSTGVNSAQVAELQRLRPKLSISC